MRSRHRARYLPLLAGALLCRPLPGETAPDVAQDRKDERVFKNPFAQTFAFWFEFDTARPIWDHSRVQKPVQPYVDRPASPIGALRQDSECVRLVLESNAGNVHHAW